MVAEVAIVCLTVLIGLGMFLYYLRQSKPPQVPLNQKELDELRSEIKRVEVKFAKNQIQKVFQ
jgi:hypothetical protein